MKDIHWIHQIPLPDGTITPGVSRPAIDDFGLAEINVLGQRVLDVGCLDGLYTFYAERRGAAEVVSIDILEEQFGPQDQHYNTAAGYLWAHKRLNSGAKYVFPFSIYDVTPEQFGQFDVVYCMGVLYHLAHPMLALERLNAILRIGGTLVLESEVSATRSLFSHRLCHTKTFPIIHRVTALQASVRFAKIALLNPKMACRLLLFITQQLKTMFKQRSNNSNIYAIDPTVLVVPDIGTLEQMIDFAGFAIERAFSRATRMAYHCRKVAPFDPTFAAKGKYRDAERITNMAAFSASTNSAASPKIKSSS